MRQLARARLIVYKSDSGNPMTSTKSPCFGAREKARWMVENVSLVRWSRNVWVSMTIDTNPEVRCRGRKAISDGRACSRSVMSGRSNGFVSGLARIFRLLADVERIEGPTTLREAKDPGTARPDASTVAPMSSLNCVSSILQAPVQSTRSVPEAMDATMNRRSMSSRKTSSMTPLNLTNLPMASPLFRTFAETGLKFGGVPLPKTWMDVMNRSVRRPST